MSNKLVKRDMLCVKISKFEIFGDVIVRIIDLNSENLLVTLSGKAATDFLEMNKNFIRELKDRAE